MRRILSWFGGEPKQPVETLPEIAERRDRIARQREQLPAAIRALQSEARFDGQREPRADS